MTPQATVGRTVAAFAAGPSAVPWMLSAMPLGLAVALLPAVALLTAGALADDRGRRRVFSTGLGLLAVGALVCATAAGTPVFITGRLLQGVGGAAVLACGLGLIGSVYPPGPARARATGVWGASIGGGIAVGGLLPVAVDPGNSWRISYAVTAAAALLLAIGARMGLNESRAEEFPPLHARDRHGRARAGPDDRPGKESRHLRRD